ncbi:unnamed protein product [Linum trigynum]
MARPRPSLSINGVLPHHLLLEVFGCLPLTDAFRCRSVCKLWLSCLRDDPYFIGQYILRRIREQPLNEEDQGRTHVQCNVSEMLVLTPTWNLPPGFSFSLDFLPVYAGLDRDHKTLKQVVEGFSNGLLLCSPNVYSRRLYYICNPLTKQWLALPRSPRFDHPYFLVAFFCDPFYSQGDNGLITLNHRFRFKVVRLLNGWGIKEGEILVEMFSSQKGCWTTSKLILPESVLPEHYLRSVVPCNGKLYCLIEPCDTFVYDPDKNEFLQDCIPPPLNLTYIQNDLERTLEALTGFSLCRGSLWIGQCFPWHLRIFELVDGGWRMRHDVDVSELDSCLRVKDMLFPYSEPIVFRTMHPLDSMLAYFSVENVILECDFRAKRLNLVSECEHEGNRRDCLNVSPVVLPLWPTPLPALWA